jgi:argininosuccinate lyase
MQEDKEPIFDSAATLRGSLEVMEGALATLRVHEGRMREAAGDPLLLATDLAEALVREGVPFRDAHEAVGKVVAHCVEKQLDLRALTREELRIFHAAFPADARSLASLEHALEARDLPGATARGRVATALDRADAEIAAGLAALGAGGER